MKEIELTKGYKAIVDDEDYDRLMRFKWHIHFDVDRIYVSRSERINGRSVTTMMQREILKDVSIMMHIDHKSGNRLDNRKCNLRVCTQSQNLANNDGHICVNKSSMYKGVVRRGSRWCAQISVNGQTKNLGTYSHEEAAAKIYNMNALSLWGEFAVLNKL